MRGAGGGRPRKPEGTTRHWNKPHRETITVAADARVDEIPEPAFPLAGPRLRIWNDLWSTPIASLWDPVDIVPLTRMVFLQTSPEALLDRGLLAEMRQLEDRFLLNPYARAQQRVVIAGVDDTGAAESARERTQASATVARLDDRRRRLGA